MKEETYNKELQRLIKLLKNRPLEDAKLIYEVAFMILKRGKG